MSTAGLPVSCSDLRSNARRSLCRLLAVCIREFTECGRYGPDCRRVLGPVPGRTVQAWKFVTFDALAASVSSAHASRSSAWSSGDMGAPGTRSAATTGLMGAAVAPLRRKRLLRPISVPPFPSAQSINVLSMRPGHYDRAPSPMAKRIAAAEQTR